MSEPVECRSDDEYAQRPLAIVWQGQRLAVDAILASWRTPDGKHFRIRTQEQGIFDLYYDQTNDQWSIQPT